MGTETTLSMPEIEKSFLGTLLCYPDYLEWVYPRLSTDWLSSEGKEIYHAMQDATNEDGKFDFSVVYNRLYREGKEELADLSAILYQDAEASGERLKVYLKELHKNYIENRKNEILMNTLQDIKNKKEVNVMEVIKNIETIQEEKFEESPVFADDIADEVERIESSIGKELEFPTDFKKLDDMTGGLHRGEMFVIGGATSTGKTAFALTLTSNLAKRGKKIMINSLEMGKSAVLRRLLVMETGINLFAKISHLSKDNLKEIKKVAKVIKSWDIKILKGEYSIKALQHQVSLYSPDIVIVDHLQLFPTKKAETRNLAIGEISRELKLLAEEFNLVMIVLSQFRRGACDKNRIPHLDDLRESGDIEQNADVVGLLYRKWLYDKEANRSEVDFYIAKNRNGEVGNDQLSFLDKKMKFYNMTK